MSKKKIFNDTVIILTNTLKTSSLISVLILFLILCSCNEKVQIEQSGPNGIWKQIGYGNIAVLNDTTISVYNISKQNCLLAFEEHLLDFGKVKDWKKDTLTIRHGIDDWKFVRLNKLPDLCERSEVQRNDPKHNFQVFWDTFNEHYASFAIKNVNWSEVYEEYEPLVSANTTDLEMYTIFRQMIERLNDNHIKMQVPSELESQYKDQIEGTKEQYSTMDVFALNKEIAKLYVDSLRNYNAGMIRYGLIDNKIGYVQINAMLMLADYDLEDNLDLRSFYSQYWEKAENRKDELQRQDEVKGINKILDVIIDDMPQAQSYILDLRFNGGGKDGVALAILNHFSNSERIVFTKKARTDKGFTKAQNIKVVPSKKRFNGNVYLLTSHLTASASEILVLASLAQSNIKRIGSTTEGIFSSTLDKKLPNGWQYELSNEIYQDLNGTSYENIGIPPDYQLNYPENKDAFIDQLLREVDNKMDSAINLVLELEHQKVQ